VWVGPEGKQKKQKGQKRQKGMYFSLFLLSLPFLLPSSQFLRKIARTENYFDEKQERSYEKITDRHITDFIVELFHTAWGDRSTDPTLFVQG
jgi:hypothetical protein